MSIDDSPFLQLPAPVHFYMYMESELLGASEFRRLLRCRREHPVPYLQQNSSFGVVSEFTASKFFVQMMATHPWRTRDVSAANIFIVALDLSPFNPTDLGPCSWAQYDAFLLASLHSLIRLQPFQSSSGLDHLWVLSDVCPEILLRMHAPKSFSFIHQSKVLQHMMVGVMELFPLRTVRATPLNYDFTSYKFIYRTQLQGSEKHLKRLPWRRRPWRCSLPVPFVQSFAFSPEHEKHESTLHFEEWLSRKYTFFHNTGTAYQGRLSKELRQQVLRVPDFAADPGRVWVGESFLDSATLKHGFESSRFCFCIAGRVGGPTRKFYDAVANLCIPVVVGDQWLFSYAPFSTYIDHEKYAIFVPEKAWMDDLPFIVRTLEFTPTSVLHDKFRALQSVVPILLYDTVRSHALGSVLLWEASSRCTADAAVNDSTMLPIGVPLRRRVPVMVLSGTHVAHYLSSSII